MLKNKKGFTLIELLVVIVIIGILAAIVGGIVLANGRKRANDATAKSRMGEIKKALEVYYNDNDAYPAELTELVDDYMKTVPVAPKGDWTYATADGSFTLSYTLEVSTDKGPNVVDGVYTLEGSQ